MDAIDRAFNDFVAPLSGERSPHMAFHGVDLATEPDYTAVSFETDDRGTLLLDRGDPIIVMDRRYIVERVIELQRGRYRVIATDREV